MKNLRQQIWFALLVLPLVLGACSGSGTKPDGEDEDAALTMSDDALPDSDDVGSIPEDGGDSLNEINSDDPFADLEDNLSSGGSGDMVNYTIQRGDTLMKIAFAMYGDIGRWTDLRDWNSSTVGSGNILSVGKVIQYKDEGGFELNKLDYSYRIKTGDTLGGIAKQLYGKVMKYRKLQRYNSALVKNPNRIFAGFDLYYNVTAQEQKEAEAARINMAAVDLDDESTIATAAEAAGSIPSGEAPSLPSAVKESPLMDADPFAAQAKQLPVMASEVPADVDVALAP